MNTNMISKFCINLDLNIDPVPVNYHSNMCEPPDKLSELTKKVYQKKIDLDILSKDIILFAKDHSLRIHYAESFFTKPNVTGPIHTDNAGGDYIKLNFKYGGEQSTMNWYTAKKDSPEIYRETRYTPEKNPYVLWDKRHVELVESNEINYPSIVQVGWPHNIITLDKARLCISLTLHDTKYKKLSNQISMISIAEAYKRFSYLMK